MGYSVQSGATTSLAEWWNGSLWRLQGVPSLSGGSELLSVSCPSPSFCTALGRGTTGDYTDIWNGSRWTLGAAPQAGMSALSCSSPTFCMAVGSTQNSSGETVPFAQSWNGIEWSDSPVATPPGLVRGNFDGVSCIEATFCAAVGSGGDASTQNALMGTWNGTTWAVRLPPPPDSQNSGLSGVACTSVAACVGVGSYAYGLASLTLIDRWNGAGWSPVASPNPSMGPSRRNGLNAVSCTTTSCTAVGGYEPAPTADDRNGATNTLVEAN